MSNTVLLSECFRSRASCSHQSLLLIIASRIRRRSSSSTVEAVMIRNHCHHQQHRHRVQMLPIRTKFTSSQHKSTINKKSPPPPPTQRKINGNKSKYLFISLTAFIAINAFGTYVHFHDNLFQYYPLPFAVDMGTGPSMLPTMTPDRSELYLRDVWSHRSIFNSREYQKGDIVTMYNPFSNSIVTKRIVGVEGDTIRLCGEYASEFCKRDVEGGGVPLDGRFDPPFCHTMQYEYLDGAPNNNTVDKKRVGINFEAKMKVPPNHVWVEGDNPLESTDSRHYGPMPLSALRGRIVLRLWPMMSAGGFYSMTGERPSPIAK